MREIYKNLLVLLGLVAFAAMPFFTPSAFGQAAVPQPIVTPATVTAVDTTNGLSLSNGTISLAAAGAAQNGAVTTGTQTFLGAKTFSSGITTSGLSSPNAVSLTGGASLSMAGNGIFTHGASTGNQARIQNNLGASAASTTVAAFELRHVNGALDATDLEFSVLDSSSNILFSVNESGLSIQRSGAQLNTAAAAEPTCNAAARGTIWYTASGAGVADKMQICAKAAADTYAWRSMATIP